jgi:DNA repair protein RadC
VRDAGCATGIWWFVRQNEGGWKRERLLIVVLDQNGQILGAGEAPLATMTAVRLRGILKDIPLARAAGLVSIHNQPKTRPRLPESDTALIACLRRSAEEIGVPLLDHAVFCDGRFHSLADQLLQPHRKGDVPAHHGPHPARPRRRRDL